MSWSAREHPRNLTTLGHCQTGCGHRGFFRHLPHQVETLKDSFRSHACCLIFNLVYSCYNWYQYSTSWRQELCLSQPEDFDLQGLEWYSTFLVGKSSSFGLILVPFGRSFALPSWKKRNSCQYEDSYLNQAKKTTSKRLLVICTSMSLWWFFYPLVHPNHWTSER